MYQYKPNEGLGGYSIGRYDLTTKTPTPYNWTRQLDTSFPIEKPQIKRLVTIPEYINSNIVCNNEGKIFIGAQSGKVYQVNPNGDLSILFEDRTRSIPMHTPIIAENNYIYAIESGYFDNESGVFLYLLHPGGKIEWKQQLEAQHALL